MKQTVVIGITSGIAAYKSLGLIKLLKHEGLDVAVIMTNSATKMIPLHKVEKVSGNKVFVELFEKNFNYKNILKSRKVDHIDIADKADIMVIVPATANIIAKLAHGIADDFLTTTALAVTAPILLSPSMNINMWNNPIIQENIMKLQEKGFQIIEPAEGMLACGYEGKGRLPDIQTIKDEIQRNLQYIDSLKGKKIIVTAGATIEKIDDVRYITNRSSGKMGIRIAEECYLRGAKVLLLRAKHSIKPRYLIEEEIFDSADDLAKLIEKHIRQYEVFFHVAAVSDFSVKKQPGKIK
ncbi:bifunctional phosphopantothenoylcysteine decarboxylase/phosphopantothenate--cysteine ligase CoaBC, partial [Candidatus Roizmanbacteria bacterium]|nr:bifunctional phosphopantothenoylcysteine decarboxylase/phosphopantothenate--cysteine ligase CoaBC [Candidatus Roizmanbacteria bacterium]